MCFHAASSAFVLFTAYSKQTFVPLCFLCVWLRGAACSGALRGALRRCHPAYRSHFNESAFSGKTSQEVSGAAGRFCEGRSGAALALSAPRSERVHFPFTCSAPSAPAVDSFSHFMLRLSRACDQREAKVA